MELEGDRDAVTRRLVEGARAGDGTSFERLVERLAPALYGWARLRIPRSLRPYLDAEDVVQEVWVRAMRALDNYDPRTMGFRPWLFGVAKHTLLDADRRQRARLPPSPAAGISQVPEAATTLSRRVARSDAVQRFLERVERMDESSRALIVHCGLEGMPLAQVAQRLGIGPSACEKRWQRLRKRLLEEPWARELLD